MTNMESLKIMVDLNWAIRFNRLDKMFSDSDKIISFNHFLSTAAGKRWAGSEEYKKFCEWQNQ